MLTRLRALATCLLQGHTLRFIRTTTLKEKQLERGALAIYRCDRCQRSFYTHTVPASAPREVLMPSGAIHYIVVPPMVETLAVGADVPELDAKNPPADVSVS